MRSHGYGINSPAKGERAAPKESEPRWNPTRTASIDPELPPTPRSALNDKVGWGTGWIG